MRFDTLIFDPSPCCFPKPCVPLLPTGFADLTLHAAQPWAPDEHFRHYARGRYALHQACRLAGVGPGKALLAPAYHCRTMLDPAIALGADLLLYPVTPDLRPDIDALEVLAAQAAAPVSALLVTHFFGFPIPLEELADWCRARGIALIEDGCHSFFTPWHRPENVGRCGDWVVSSPYKFLPSIDGGLLYAANPPVLEGVDLASPAWLSELRSFVSLLKKAAGACRDGYPPEIAAAPLASPVAIERCEQSGCSPDYHIAEEHLGSHRLSHWLGQHADVAAISLRRRENYLRWMVATESLPACRPLFPELPARTIPYMFPLLIDRPATDFYALKHAGVPIWRWDSMLASNCPTANDYRLRLLHLPCHQSLGDKQLDWMISALTKVGAGETAPRISRTCLTALSHS
jgi:hypothetical protein